MGEIVVHLDELVMGSGPPDAAVAARLRDAPAARMLGQETLDTVAASVSAVLATELTRLQTSPWA